MLIFIYYMLTRFLDSQQITKRGARYKYNLYHCVFWYELVYVRAYVFLHSYLDVNHLSLFR